MRCALRLMSCALSLRLAGRATSPMASATRLGNNEAQKNLINQSYFIIKNLIKILKFLKKQKTNI